MRVNGICGGESCKTLLKLLHGDRCVFCSYGTIKCPPIKLYSLCCNYNNKCLPTNLKAVIQLIDFKTSVIEFVSD